ncbi:hypothetical protein [Bifidobacterium gallicum]|uniref:hypothetical protein n=1 Tax=Bifidobacterium gallicum TaxID=78342 RepID=UPI0001BC37B9|nr:hypothetical protein [Bifidobacterium gallicum]
MSWKGRKGRTRQERGDAVAGWGCHGGWTEIKSEKGKRSVEREEERKRQVREGGKKRVGKEGGKEERGKEEGKLVVGWGIREVTL